MQRSGFPHSTGQLLRDRLKLSALSALNAKSCNSANDPIADLRFAWKGPPMLSSNRIGALNIAEALSERLVSYVDVYSIEFLAVKEGRIHCWYQSPVADGPVFHGEMVRDGNDWSLHLTEHPPGTEQQIETPCIRFPPQSRSTSASVR